MPRLLLVGLLLGLLSSLAYVVDQKLDSFYIFDPAHLHSLARRGIDAHGNDTRAVVDFLVGELREHAPTAAYVSMASPNEATNWFFNNAGGAMGGMYIIHSSVTEYLIIFGTAIGTEGHTGRHTADDYFHILSGTQLAYSLGSFEPEVYPPGSVHHLRRGQVKQYRMPEGCFALEYARGWIPPMLFFGYADGFTSTLDLSSLWDMTRFTAREMGKNLARGKF